MQNIPFHPQYSLTLLDVQEIRHCVEGQPSIKREERKYLPFPSDRKEKGERDQMRYKRYLYGAEFDEVPGQTLEGMIGRMNIGNSNILLPDAIATMENDADGDGLSLRGAIKEAMRGVVQFKFQVLLADYKGLGSVNLDQLSQAEVQELDPRPTIKQYDRENVLNWHYRRVNGKMQLSYMALREVGQEFDPEGGVHTEIESILIVALDEDGCYYQQKAINRVGKSFEMGERNYVTVNGELLKWIPIQVACDQELPAGNLPKELGYLAPICSKSLYRYRMYAEYKEAARNLSPTTYTRGWKANGMELFDELNGRKHIETGSGAVNNMPQDVEVSIIGGATGDALGDFRKYLEQNEKEIRALGGAFKTIESSTATATEAAASEMQRNAYLITVAESLESAFKRVISYCAMFKGVWGQEEVEDRIEDIQIDLPRDFSRQKLSVEEVREITNLVLSGLKPRDEAIRELSAGGWSLADAEEIINMLDGGMFDTAEQ